MTLALTYDAANPTLAFAAGELARHIARLGLPAGGAYPVTLAVQPEAFAQENDSYRCAFTPAGGEICAGSARAVLLGVYAYLRALGFLFMQPGETFVPSVASPAALCLSLSHTAAHRQRGVCIEGANSLRNALAMIDWLPKLGMNAFFIQFKQPDTFFSRWYAHELNPLRQGRPLSRRALDRMDAAMAKAAALRGLELHRAGHGWTAEALGFSAGGWQAGGALPAERASLCALVDGKRALFGGVPANTNLCLSRPAARRALADHICAYALAHPEADVLHVWLADECNNVCECPSCQASLPAEPFIALLGDVDARLTQLGLPARIAFPLYQELLYPPQRVRLTGRFLMMFAPISRTFESPYPRALPAGAPPPYIRNRMTLPVSIGENLRFLAAWRRAFGGECFFYDYPLGRAHYGDFGGMAIARVIYADVRALHALGADGYISCQELRAALPTAFPNYVMGMALLDESADFDALAQAYFSARFGDMGASVRAYLTALSGLSEIDYVNGKGPRVQPRKAARFDAARALAQAFAPVARAQQAAAPRQRKNAWAALAYHAQVVSAHAGALSLLCRGETRAANAAFRAFCALVRQSEPRFQPLLDVYRVIEVSCKYTGFENPQESAK